MTKNKLQEGYIALMATIVISLVLLVMVVEEGSAGWYARFNILGTEAKEQASSLAEGCAEQAMATLLTNPSYTGDATTTNSIGSCYIFPIQLNYPVAGLVTIKTQAVVNDSYANLHMAMNMNDIHFGSIPTAPTTGTLFITTHVINDSSGSKTAGDFTINVSANPNSSSAGDEGGVAKIVQPGAYSITPSAMANYAITQTADCSGTVAAGQVKFCTITADDITTTITVIANVTNDNLGTSTPSEFAFFIDGAPVTLGARVPVSAGTHTVTATPPNGNYASSPWGYDCNSGGSVTLALGQNKTCIINYNDLPPPAPSCADTVMILDRTGSMSSTDRNNEKNAANALVALYSGVLPPVPSPQLGVGSIGGLDGSAASVPTLGQLTTTYNNLLTSITQMMNTTSSVGSNLAAGLIAASNELNSSRHIVNPPAPATEKEKVIIFVSDGDPNEPSGTQNYDTGFKVASSSAQNASGESWTNGAGAFADGGTDATDPVGDNDRHQFSVFGFGNGTGLPTGSTVRGIEVLADAWATAGTTNTPANSSRTPTSGITPNQWSNPTRANNNDDSYVTTSTNGAQQGFGGFGFSIPSNATITGIALTTEAKVVNTTSTQTGVLIPTGQGNYNSWSGDTSDIDDNGTPSCNSGDRIDSSSNNSRESFNLNLSSIPNNVIITSVQIFTWDQQGSGSTGTYQTFARVNGNNDDSGINLQTTSTSGCTSRSQTIDIDDIVKTNSTDLEIGVIKTNSANVRIGAIRAVISYVIPTATGSLNIALTSNGGTSYSSTTRNVSLTNTEAVSTPSGNSNTDLWGRSWTPNDFANANFGVRVQNNSTGGNLVSLDEIVVTVYYTVPTSTGAACQLGMDLSWNGGSSWTNEKIQNINGTETTYTLGGTTDDWTSSHTWTPTEFSNTNFRARIRAVDPGSSCDPAAVEHLDFLQVKVHYSQTVDPTAAALNAADAAKASGVDIFTIHFGSDPSGYAGRELLANIASGNAAVSGHQNGSVADANGVVSGNTGNVSPTINAADTGGDGNGFESNPTRVYTDGPSGTSGAALNQDGAGDRHRFSGYAFSLPPNAVVTGIAVRADWWVDSTSGTNSLGVELSYNGGTNWTSAKTDTGESTSSSNSGTFGSSSDTWGRTWSASDFSTANFRVRVTSNSTVSSRDFYLDWLPVTIYYTVNQENNDGDNFFIAPTSADMQDIFEFIGNQVCPASMNLAAAPPPTTGTLLISTLVTNNNGGSKAPSDFIINLTAQNPSTTTFAGSSTGVTVTVNPGNHSVSQNAVPGYTGIPGASCSSGGSLGPIAAGETRVCVINNDDIPPPPPPPNLNFNTNTWQEIPTASP